MIGLQAPPFMPSRLGGTPGPPGRLGLGGLGISVSTAGTCPHTESHTTCEGGRTVSKNCTAYRDCKTGALVGTDCWNDTVCDTPHPSPAPSGGGGGTSGTPAPPSAPAPTSADGWTKCASEGGTCDWPGALADLANVRYGAGSKWTEKDNLADKVACSSNIFGDPYGGHTKECWYKPIAPVALPPAPPIVVTPGGETAPPIPMQECDAPASPALDFTERWVQVDPVKCLWQIIRTATPGQPVALPNVYSGSASILIPQSAPPSETPLSPGAVGLYQPSTAPIGGAVEVTDAEITQAFLDVLGIGPTPDQLTTAENQHFANIADLYTYVHTLGGTSTGTGGGSSWVTEHPYVTLGIAAAGLWFIFGGKRR